MEFVILCYTKMTIFIIMYLISEDFWGCKYIA